MSDRSDRTDVIIYMRYTSLNVVIPERHVWEFMAEFGNAFAVEDAHEGTKHIKAVDNYYDHPAGWHVMVTVWYQDESRFYSFLRKFCNDRSLSFRDPEESGMPF